MSSEGIKMRFEHRDTKAQRFYSMDLYCFLSAFDILYFDTASSSDLESISRDGSCALRRALTLHPSRDRSGCVYRNLYEV